MTRLDDPYDEGAAACLAGEPRSANPYSASTDQFEWDAWDRAAAYPMTCPPCTNDCNQGRSCPNRRQRSFGDLWAAAERRDEMNKNDLIAVALVMSPIILVLLLMPAIAENETKQIVACINAGMEWIDGGCVKGETK